MSSNIERPLRLSGSAGFVASLPAAPISGVIGVGVDGSTVRSVERPPPPRAVIADGDAGLRRRMRALLGYAGYAVEICGDGAALLDIIAEIAKRRAAGLAERLDVVFCDVNLSSFGGLCVLESLTLAGWDVPFVLMTDGADRASSRRASGFRTSGILQKPFSGASLLAVVEALAPLPDAADDA